jgi:hypothetical protein
MKKGTVRRVTECRSVAVRRVDRWRLRWEDDVREVLGKMKLQNWSKMAMDRSRPKLTKNCSALRRCIDCFTVTSRKRESLATLLSDPQTLVAVVKPYI